MRKDIRFYGYIGLCALGIGLELVIATGQGILYLLTGDGYALLAMVSWLFNVAVWAGLIRQRFYVRNLREETEYLHSLRMLFSPTRMARKTWDTH